MANSNKGKGKVKKKSKSKPAAGSSKSPAQKEGQHQTKNWVIWISVASIIVAVVAVLAVVLPKDSTDKGSQSSLEDESKLMGDGKIIGDNVFEHDQGSSVAPSAAERPPSPSWMPTLPDPSQVPSYSSATPSDSPSSIPSSFPSTVLPSNSPSVPPSASPTTSTRQPTSSPSDAAPSSAPTHMIANFGNDYKVILTLPHDTSSFTQGLFTHDGILYEGTGQNGESVVRKFAADNVTVVAETPLEAQYFGEGISIYPDPTDDGKLKLIQLTWLKDVGFIYDLETLERERSFSYETTTSQGWGISYNKAQEEFYVSDGSEYIHVWNLQLEQIRRFPVSFQLRPDTPIRPAKMLNELEYDHTTDTLLANMWMHDVLLRINVTTGETIHVYDFSTLYLDRENKDPDAVFNGVSLTQVPNQIWVTGKYWPTLYLVELLK